MSWLGRRLPGSASVRREGGREGWRGGGRDRKGDGGMEGAKPKRPKSTKPAPPLFLLKYLIFFFHTPTGANSASSSSSSSSSSSHSSSSSPSSSSNGVYTLTGPGVIYLRSHSPSAFRKWASAGAAPLVAGASSTIPSSLPSSSPSPSSSISASKGGRDEGEAAAALVGSEGLGKRLKRRIGR